MGHAHMQNLRGSIYWIRLEKLDLILVVKFVAKNCLNCKDSSLKYYIKW